LADIYEQERTKKLAEIRAMGVRPYGHRFDEVGPLARFGQKYAEMEGQTVPAAGRIMALRSFGKAVFLDLRDRSGKVQVYLKQGTLDDASFAVSKLLDLGDIIAVKGKLGKTKTGEVTIFAESMEILSKALLPPPEKWHGLKDVEIRYRKRYVDLFANPPVMETFRIRSEVIRAIRRYLDDRGFLEVETPMMQTIPGGAAARPFITHHNALDMDLYLRVSPELFLKKLIVGGMERVYEINRNFRNEGISTRHNPEFTMIEIYQAYGDYRVMMDITEDIVSESLKVVPEQSRPAILVSTPRPWPRKTFADLIAEHSGINAVDEAAVMQKARELRLETAGLAKDPVLDKIFEATVQPHLAGPVFVTHYPLSLCPLAKECPDQPGIADRWELYVNCMELANAYTELNDPLEQDRRFRAQIDTGEGELRTVDESFVDALKYGMPPTGGLGIGIDRLIMALTGHHSIRDVILFPLMKPETDNV
jgi:lysyl-tRNA synthetase, class II